MLIKHVVKQCYHCLRWLASSDTFLTSEIVVIKQTVFLCPHVVKPLPTSFTSYPALLQFSIFFLLPSNIPHPRHRSALFSLAVVGTDEWRAVAFTFFWTDLTHLSAGLLGEFFAFPLAGTFLGFAVVLCPVFETRVIPRISSYPWNKKQ